MTSGQEILQAAYRIPPASILKRSRRFAAHTVDALRLKLLYTGADKEAGLEVSAQ